MIELKSVRLSLAALTSGALFACTAQNTTRFKKSDTERPQVSLQLNLPKFPTSLLLADEAAQVLNLVLRTTSATGESKLVPVDVKTGELELDAPTGKVVFEALYLIGLGGGAVGFEKSACDQSHTSQYFFARAKNTVEVREEGQVVALEFGNLVEAKTTLLALNHSNAIDSKVAWVDPVLKAPLNSGCASKNQDWSWGTESSRAKMRVPLLGDSSTPATGQSGFLRLSTGVFELKGLSPSDDRIFGFSTKAQAADAAPGAGESIPEGSFSPEFLRSLLPLPVVTLEATEEIGPRAVVAKGSCDVEGRDVILSGASLTGAVAKCVNRVYQAKLAAGPGPLSRKVKATHANRLGGETSVEQTLVLTPPRISDVTDKSTNQDVPLSAIPFTITNADSSLNCSTSLVVSSSNLTLLPIANISVGGKVPSCTVSLIPAAKQSGATTVTLTFDDGALAASDSFVLTVDGVNDAPTISAISAQITDEDESVSLSFSVSDLDNTLNCNTSLLYTSSNPALVPSSGAIVFSGTAPNCTATITPSTNQAGSASISFTVSDGSLANTATFSLSVVSVNDAPTISDVASQSTNQWH